ncbi:MAG: hypothetical protein ABI649_08445 [Gaiellaceae bacterium]
MIYGIDHIVLAVPGEERSRIADGLLGAGFEATPLDLDFPELSAASESFAMASGGYVELVYEREPGPAPAVWFAGAPRVIGVGFSSDDFDHDVAAWGEPDGMWRMNENKPLPDGSVLNIHAAGPHPHLEPFYVFVMDTPVPLFARLGAEPRLVRLTFSGAEAGTWRERLTAWLALVGPAIGAVELRFEETDEAGVRVTPAFVAPGPPAPIPLAAGAIVFASSGGVAAAPGAESQEPDQPGNNQDQG